MTAGLGIDLTPRIELFNTGAGFASIPRPYGWEAISGNNWASHYKIPAELAYLSKWVSKCLEAFRKDDRPNFEENAAVILIVCYQIAKGIGFDLTKEIREKMIVNKTRGFRHGNKRV